MVTNPTRIALTFLLSPLLVIAFAMPVWANSEQKAGEVSLPALRYFVVSSGPATGQHPSRRDRIVVDYSLSLEDGSLVDASSRRNGKDVFLIRDLVPAWQVLVPLMRPGDDWIFFVPPQYAYGSTSREGIPANSNLKFRVRLISSEEPQQ